MSSFASELDTLHNDHRKPELVLPQARQRFFERKYLVDFLIAGVLLVVCSPIIIFCWILVKLTSKGPGFYRQKRLGHNGEVFEIFKIRTMRVDAEADGKAVWCKKNDCRITLVGHTLRKMHLDEFPQLFNVIRGEMSLVGPRPERPEICDRLCLSVPDYFNRIAVKPGITGLSQINLEPDQELEDAKNKQILDLDYIRTTNWWLEFRIVFATALRLFGIKGGMAMKLMGLDRRHLVQP